MTLLQMKSVSKAFGGTRVLNQVSLSVEAGEIVALMGENGAGKSTLMKILSGIWPGGSFEGQILISGEKQNFLTTKDAHRAGIAMIHQELSVFPELTVAEHLELDRLPLWVSWPKVFEKTQKFLDQLGFGLNAQARVGDLSVGGQQLVEIARALYQNAQILVFDEPTSALTESEVIRLYEIMDQLKLQKKGIIYITHRLDEVFRLADRLVVLRDGQKVEEILTRENGIQKNRKEIEPELIRLMVGREINDIYPVRSTYGGEELLRVENLSLTSPRGKLLVKGLNFCLKQGEVLGLAGLLGAGRSETFEALFGVLNGSGPRGSGYQVSGEVWIRGEKVTPQTPRHAIASKMAFVSEDRKGSGLVLGHSIHSNMLLPALAAGADFRVSRQSLQTWAKELKIKSTHLDQPVGQLSGGNQQKVVLAKWLMTSPEVFFLDEPTRGIDVGAKVEIYQWIQKLSSQGMGLVVASSEMPELLGICHRILVLREGKLSAEFPAEKVTQEEIMRAASL